MVHWSWLEATVAFWVHQNKAVNLHLSFKDFLKFSLDFALAFAFQVSCEANTSSSQNSKTPPFEKNETNRSLRIKEKGVGTWGSSAVYWGIAVSTVPMMNAAMSKWKVMHRDSHVLWCLRQFLRPSKTSYLPNKGKHNLKVRVPLGIHIVDATATQKKEAEFDDFNLHLLDGGSQISCVIYPARGEVAHCSVSLRRLADDDDVKQINIISLSVCSKTTDDVPKHLKLSLGSMYKTTLVGANGLVHVCFQNHSVSTQKESKRKEHGTVSMLWSIVGKHPPAVDLFIWVTDKIWYMAKGHPKVGWALPVLQWRHLVQTFLRVSFWVSF